VLSETVTLLRRELGPRLATDFGREFIGGKVAQLVRCDSVDGAEALKLIDKFTEQKLIRRTAAGAQALERWASGRNGGTANGRTACQPQPEGWLL